MTVELPQLGDRAHFAANDIEQSIVSRFESRVALVPDRAALSDRGAVLSYAELNQRANRLARRIVERVDQKRHSRVVLFMDKSPDYIVAILAVLKAGHAYVPLDPQFPAARNQHIIGHAGASVLITNSAGIERAKPLVAEGVEIIDMDDATPDQSGENLDLEISPDDMAYIIYTSGSTGQPKGVMQNHRNTLQGCWRRSQLQNVAPHDRMTLLYSCSVMGSVYCIFGALLNGASLSLYDLPRDGLAHLGDWLRNERISIYHSIASLFRQFAADYRGEVNDFDVRMVIFGGESVRVSDVEDARRMFGHGCEFYTGLGSTETGTTRHFHIGPDTKLEGPVLPIGYPVDDMDVTLLDEYGERVAVGQVGEIVVQSRFLALGYWNDAEATRLAFGPEDDQTARRLYRTGDMGCMDESGLLMHRGRKDAQVTIRGYRVEIGEVEAALLDHPDVFQVAVTTSHDAAGDQKLVAYVVLQKFVEIDASSIRAVLGQRLPSHMVPTTFVPLPELPLTPNGKIDRLRLPVPEVEKMENFRNVLPVNQVEHRLISIFEEVLQTSGITRHDNFFDLGGHSLSALSVITSVNRRFGVDVPPIILFSYPTIEELARVLSDLAGGVRLPSMTGAASLDPAAAGRVDELIASVKALATRTQTVAPESCPKMRESWICKQFLARLYAYHRRSVRRVLTTLILKLERGKTFSVTMRRLFAKYHEIEIGDFTAVVFDDRPLRPTTRIGRYCSIYSTAVFQNADHPRNTMATHGLFYAPGYGFTPGYDLDRKQIEIGNDVWIGNGAKILYPTQTIGDGAVIGAGAVVIEDVPPYAVVGGHPAQVIRYRFSEETIAKLLEARWWDYSLEELSSVRETFMTPLEGNQIR
jgi:amino acid adenylation domain-containing protein